MEEIYNKWQLQDLDLGNTEPYQFTKSELINFAEYAISKKLTLTDVVLRSELLLEVICEYNKINTYSEIKKVEEWIEKWDSK